MSRYYYCPTCDDFVTDTPVDHRESEPLHQPPAAKGLMQTVQSTFDQHVERRP